MVTAKTFTSFSKVIPAFLALVVVWANTSATHAQLGTSSMSFNSAAARAAASSHRLSAIFPSLESIRIEEFINYHEHDIPLPNGEQDIRLSVRHLKIDGDETLVQVGISTPQQFDTETMPPLNLVLVIDQSGSMATENRIGKVKDAIDALVERFRKNDRIAIVGFSNQASVVLDSCRKTNRVRIRDAVDSLCSGGGTNLHDGLRRGYEIAMENYDPERTNRVLFLTDGNANVGVTEPSTVAEMSETYNRKGISLSTIGVGSDFNQELLTTLADAGKGLSHFVGDQDDIEKIFVGDFESLLAPVANNVRLKLDFGVPAEEVQIFGYSQSILDWAECEDSGYDGEDVVLQLKDLNCGVTQVVMATIPTTRNLDRIKVKLTAEHATSGRDLKLRARSESADGPEAKSIKRDYAIAVLAAGIKRASKQASREDAHAAQKTLKAALRESDRQLGDRRDENVTRVKKIAKRYVSQLDDHCDDHDER